MSLLTEGKSSVFYCPKLGDTLMASGKSFVIRSESGETKKKIPAISTRDIVIFGDATITSSVLKLSRSEEIPIHFTDRRGKLTGTIRYDFSKNVFLRHKQIHIHDDTIERFKLANAFVKAKIANQNVFLRKMRVSERLEETTWADNLESLRGEEGAMARKYFSAWGNDLLKNKDFFFYNRVKRPPHDKTNALLSFCYSLLHAEALSQILIAGLDPYFGFLHDQRFGHAALASDIIEPFRAPIDHFVIRSINLREFSSQDFTEEVDGSVVLSSLGLQKFFPKWTNFLRNEPINGGKKSIVGLMEKDVRSLVLFLMGDCESFYPFRWKL